MTEKERFVKYAFKEYSQNKKRLRALSFESLNGVDYSRLRLSTKAKGYESAIVGYLSEKEKLEKKIKLCDTVVWFYEIGQETEKVAFIKTRFFKGRSIPVTMDECFISERTVTRWTAEILKRGISVLENLHLFD